MAHEIKFPNKEVKQALEKFGKELINEILKNVEGIDKQIMFSCLDNLLQNVEKDTKFNSSIVKSISQIASETAKKGYKEEHLVCDNLNNNPNIKQALSPTLGNDYDKCIKIKGQGKSDIKSKNNILKAQIKKCKKDQFQQLDRHSLNHVIKHIPQLSEVSQILRNLWEYQLLPNQTHVDKSVPLTKLNSSNYTDEELNNLLEILNNNVKHILKYAFLGQDQENQPKYVIAVEYTKDQERQTITAFKIQDAINYLKTLRFKVSPRETRIWLGEDGIISIQRKGGDSGKKSSNNMQIKIKPCELINKIPHSKYNFIDP